MEKFDFIPLIVVEGETFPQARNKLLRVLAQAESDGRINRFAVSHKEIPPDGGPFREDQACQGFYCGAAPLGCSDPTHCPKRGE